MVVDYATLLRAFRKGIRTRRWMKLNPLRRAHFRAALAYSKIKGKIVNPKVLKHVLAVIKRLTSPLRRRIWRAGLEAAYAMRRRFEAKGVFDWCPPAREWLEDPDYVFYLGVSSVNSQWGGGI